MCWSCNAVVYVVMCAVQVQVMNWMICAGVGHLYAAKATWDFPPSFSLLLIGSCQGSTWVHTEAESVHAKAMLGSCANCSANIATSHLLNFKKGMGLCGKNQFNTLTMVCGGWLTQFGWKLQVLMVKFTFIYN